MVSEGTDRVLAALAPEFAGLRGSVPVVGTAGPQFLHWHAFWSAMAILLIWEDGARPMNITAREATAPSREMAT